LLNADAPAFKAINSRRCLFEIERTANNPIDLRISYLRFQFFNCLSDGPSELGRFALLSRLLNSIIANAALAR